MNADAHDFFEGKTLVVFGAGYVGGVVARQGVERGLRVVALTRNGERARELEAAGVQVVVAELASEAWWGEVGAADFVVNCVSAGGGGVEGYRRSYVEGMKSVVGWVNKIGGVKGFVYTSSTSVYPQSGGVVVREGDVVEGNTDVKARVLIEAERIALDGGACVLRLAGIYGPGRHALLDQVRAGVKMIAGQGVGRLNLVHRDDAAGAVWAVLGCTDASGEIFNVCDDGAATRGEVVAWLAERAGVTAPVFSGEGKRGALDRVISNGKIKAQLEWRARFGNFQEGYEGILSGETGK